MNTEEVAKKVMELVRKQAGTRALDTYTTITLSASKRTAWAAIPETRGKEGVRGKVDWWVTRWKCTNSRPSDPFVAHDRFVVQYGSRLMFRIKRQRNEGKCPKSAFTL